MPLVVSALESDLLDLASDPGETIPDAAAQWAAALGSYISGVIPPTTAVAAAQAALQTSLQSAFAVRPDAAAAMETAFSTFAASIALGMAPLWTGVPPVGPVGFAGFFAASPKPETHAAAANALATAIDTWAKTGTAVLVAPPNTLVNWS